MKQLSFFRSEDRQFGETEKEFGGTSTRGRRKTARPFDSKRPMFLTLKATRDEFLLRHREQVKEVVHRQCEQVGARLFSFAIQPGHLHLAIQFGNRQLYRRWIRAITGLLCREIPGIEWKDIPHSQMIHWGRHLQNIQSYIEFNEQEAGLIEWAHLYATEFELNSWSKFCRDAQVV